MDGKNLVLIKEDKLDLKANKLKLILLKYYEKNKYYLNKNSNHLEELPSIKDKNKDSNESRLSSNFDERYEIILSNNFILNQIFKRNVYEIEIMEKSYWKNFNIQRNAFKKNHVYKCPIKKNTQFKLLQINNEKHENTNFSTQTDK